MSSARTRFLRRFDRIWSQARRVQTVQAVCWAILTALAGLGLLAALDYCLELSRSARLAGLIVVAVVSSAVAIALIVQSIRRWQRKATAAAIEVVFPQLGQRIRTTVQYAELSNDQIAHDGVAATLVTALEEDTVRVAQPLPLDAVIPWKSLALASLSAAVLGLTLVGASALDWQWGTAAQRTFLSELEYTQIEVAPGNLSVREGESVVVEARVIGRLGEGVRFLSRRLDEEKAEWNEEVLDIEDSEALSDRERIFEMSLDRLKHPLEYRIVAGTNSSPIYRVDVLFPLKVVQIQAAIQPPAYTGVGEKIVEDGNITALIESAARLTIELDRAPAQAWLELQSLERPMNGETPAPEKVPLQIEGSKLSAELVVLSDKNYEIRAKAADGMELAGNKYRIRARQDEPPQVWFESPSEALEVHTLAEVLMRVRASDDFGLARAGIVFEVNNEEEYPLLEEDFQAVAEAAQEAEQTGDLSPQTRATLEKVLPLEHFALTQQDSIMYYAFAEDIKPGQPQRAESELRFIDVRPFRRLYRLLPEFDGEMPPPGGPQFKTLEELIARQRYALNRAIRLNRKFVRGGKVELTEIDGLVKFQAELATSTRELAQGLLAMGIDETELLYQAESSMLSATDSLSAGSYDTATLQMRDALKNLIEGRNRLEVFVLRKLDPRLLAQLRRFDRLQRQKLRRPESDEEEARKLADRLQELSGREAMLGEQLASLMRAQASGGTGSAAPETDDSRPPVSPMQDAKDGEGKPDESADGGKAGEATATGESAESEMGSSPTPQELEDNQLDIALEARELEKTLGRLPRATELAKERMAAAAATAEAASEAIGRGATDEAKAAVEDASAKFAELADQVRALVAEEQANRIAAAQQMAGQLARQQRDFLDRLASPGQGGGQGMSEQPGKGFGGGEQANKEQAEEDRREGLAGMAEDLAEKAKTLQDVLGAARTADAPEDEPSAEQLGALVERLAIDKTLERVGQLAGQVEAGQMEDARNNAGEGAEQLELAAEQLGALHRVIVAPELDRLAKADEAITALLEELNQLDTRAKVSGWHQEANDLLDALQQAGVDEELRNELFEELERSGFGRALDPDRGWLVADTGAYQAPAAYGVALRRLSATVQDRMQEIMLADLQYSGDEPVPPQYQDLVDRYYQVLVTKGERPASAPTETEATEE